MKLFVLIFLALIVLGAIVQTGILYSLAIGFDAMCQDIFYQDTIGVTISSRAGLAARSGTTWPAKVVNFVMCSATHCEDAIANDIARAQAAIQLLTGKA